MGKTPVKNGRKHLMPVAESNIAWVNIYYICRTINQPPNIIVDKSFAFSLDIIRYVEILESNRKYVIARQLLKSGTSIGANVREAQNAESKPDFIHKMKIAAKESDETEYWLMLCNASGGYPACDHLLTECLNLVKIIS